MDKKIRDYFKKIGAKGGRVGGKKNMASMTAAEKHAFAMKGVEARRKIRKAATKP